MNMFNASLLKKTLPRNFVVVLFISLFPFTSYAATYNVTPATFASTLASMSGGDTLILANGNYTGSIRTIKSGSAGAYTTIKAANDGGAVLTISSANAQGNGISIDGNYVKIEGMKILCTAEMNGIYISGDHNKILRTGLATIPDTATNSNVMNFVITGSYNLLEDCWTWGGGRYKYLVYGGNNAPSGESTANYNILRRCVARHDRSVSTLGNACFTSYTARWTIFENCIAIDSNQDAYYGATSWHGPFYVEKGLGVFSLGSVTLRGSIALNYSSVFLDETNSTYYNSTPGPHIITDSIGWAGDGGYSADYYETSSNVNRNITLDHVTMQTAQNCTPSQPGQCAGFNGGEGSPGSMVNMTGPKSTNSIYMGFLYALYNVQNPANNYNAFYGNTNNYGYSSKAGANDKTTINPLTNSLKYLPRIEIGGSLKGAGANGSDIGATVLYQWGTSGAAYGETGYDTLTSIPLWPWPNEDRIKADMSSYPANWPSGNLPNPVRGFTSGTSKDGSPQTLTKYIWEYLGNQIPANIYLGLSGPTPPKNPVVTKIP